MISNQNHNFKKMISNHNFKSIDFKSYPTLFVCCCVYLYIWPNASMRLSVYSGIEVHWQFSVSCLLFFSQSWTYSCCLHCIYITSAPATHLPLGQCIALTHLSPI